MQTYAFQGLNNAITFTTPGTTNTTTALPGTGRQVSVMNATNQTVLFDTGPSTVDVTTNFKYAVPAGQFRTVTMGPKDTHVALKAVAASAGNAYATRGEGIM